MRLLFIGFVLLLSISLEARPNLKSHCSGKEIVRKSHPLFKAYTNSRLCKSTFTKYDSFAYPTVDLKQDRKRQFLKKYLEGGVSQFQYLAPKGVNAIEIFRNMEVALKQANFKILLTSTPNKKPIKKGGDSSRFLRTFYPHMERNGCYMVYHNTKEAPFYLLASKTLNNGKSALISLYARGPSQQHDACDKRAPYAVTIVESSSMKMGQMVVDAKAIGSAFDLKGKIALYGVKFDFNSSAIKTESSKTLKEIAAFLKNRPKTNVYVVGHTDNKGDIKYNVSLSQKRAQAVAKYLRDVHKISQSRLTPYGVGPYSPLSTNQSDQGRLLNRRVELVEN